MPFLKLQKLCSYLLAAVGLLAILLPNILHPFAWFLSYGLLVASWFWEKPKIESLRYRKGWSRITAALFFALLSAGVLRIIANPIHIGGYLLILLMLNKLFNRLENQDLLHIYLLSFLMLTLGTILNTDISFAFCFLLYVVLITWALTLFHLRREIETTYLLRHKEDLEEGEKVDVTRILQSRRLIKSSFLLSITGIALLIFMISGAFFFVFPRVGFGLFFHRQRGGVTVSGFSNEVELGSFGKIQQNQKVVLRVELPEVKKPKPFLTWYWRGLSYDRYDGRSWKRSQRFYRRVFFSSPDLFKIKKIPLWKKKRVIKQIIYQEPLDVPVLFGIDEVYHIRLTTSLSNKIRLKLPQVRKELLSESLSYTNPSAQNTSMRYSVLSVPQRVRSFPRHYSASVMSRVKVLYTQLPKKLNPKIKALAVKWIGKAQDPMEQAKLIKQALQANYTYTLSRKAFTGPPLDDFLFVHKEGHCEYFSTAMIILLRTIDVPARQVTGFYGASWNSYGSYYAVRQSNAHSWLEVMIKGKGWVRFDPTPSSAPSISLSWFSRLDEWYDSLRLRWYKWIIEYDLDNQLQALKAIQRHFRGVSDKMSSSALEPNWKKTGASFSRWKMGALFIALMLFGYLFWRRRRKKSLAERHFSEASFHYRAALKLLEKKGFPKMPNETPIEFRIRFHEFHPELTSGLTEITQLYLSLRYDPKNAPADIVDVIQKVLRQLEDNLLEIPSLAVDNSPSVDKNISESANIA